MPPWRSTGLPRLPRPWRLVCVIVLSAGLLLTFACASQVPQPTPRATLILPTAIPTPSQNAALQFEEDPDEVEAAFHAEVEQIIAQAEFLAAAPCDRLDGAIAQDPTLVSRLRTFASSLKRLATTDQALDRQGTPFLLKRMDDGLAELDLKLASCGIRPR